RRASSRPWRSRSRSRARSAARSNRAFALATRSRSGSGLRPARLMVSARLRLAARNLQLAARRPTLVGLLAGGVGGRTRQVHARNARNRDDGGDPRHRGARSDSPAPAPARAPRRALRRQPAPAPRPAREVVPLPARRADLGGVEPGPRDARAVAAR